MQRTMLPYQEERNGMEFEKTRIWKRYEKVKEFCYGKIFPVLN
jgi:hypothetical protein